MHWGQAAHRAPDGRAYVARPSCRTPHSWEGRAFPLKRNVIGDALQTSIGDRSEHQSRLTGQAGLNQWLPASTSIRVSQVGQRYPPLAPCSEVNSIRRKPAPHSEQVRSRFFIRAFYLAKIELGHRLFAIIWLTIRAAHMRPRLCFGSLRCSPLRWLFPFM